jgi:hypothetical protein
MTDKPVISDAEVRTMLLRLGVHDNAASALVCSEALSAFLLARVPDEAKPEWYRNDFGDEWEHPTSDYADAFNACREQVLQNKT